jgi:sulfur carrier protein ThiS
MQVTVMLGGHLRDQGSTGTRGECVNLPSGSSVEDLLNQLGLSPERVCIILVNGRRAARSTRLQDRNRVALFPPQLSFNTFVSISFRERGTGKL